MQPYVFNTYYAPGTRDLGGWRVPTENLDRSRQWLQGRGSRVLHTQPYRQDPSQSTILFEDPTNNTIEFLSNHPRATLQENELDADLRASSLDQLYAARSRGTIDYLNKMGFDGGQGDRDKFSSIYNAARNSLESAPNYQDASLSAFERLKKIASGFNIPVQSLSMEEYEPIYRDMSDTWGSNSPPKNSVIMDGTVAGDVPIVMDNSVQVPTYKHNREFASAIADRMLQVGVRSHNIDPFTHTLELDPEKGILLNNFDQAGAFYDPRYPAVRDSLTHGIMRQAVAGDPMWSKTSYYDSLRHFPGSFQQVINQPLWSSQIRSLGNYAGRLLM